MDTPEPIVPTSPAQSIAEWSAAITTVDRLCLVASDTLLTVASFTAAPQRIGFPPSLSERSNELDVAGHPTTSAQCLAALQAMHAELGAIRANVGALSGTRIGLPERPLGRDDLRTRIRHALGIHLPALGEGEGDAAIATLSSMEFGVLNPLTSAQVLRVLTPSAFFLRRVWWWALFGILEALNRRSSSYDVGSGASVRDGQPTAYVSAMCVDAVSGILTLLNRRWLRFRQLTDLVRQLKAIDEVESAYGLSGTSGDEIEGTRDRRYLINMQLRECLDGFQFDAALPLLWGAWRDAERERLEQGSATAEDLARSFGIAVQRPEVVQELRGAPRVMTETLDEIKQKYIEQVDMLVELLTKRVNGDLSAVPARTLASIVRGLKWLQAENPPYGTPGWFTSLKAAESLLGQSGTDATPATAHQLHDYWSRHGQAARDAVRVCRMLADYLAGVLDAYLGCPSMCTADMLLAGFKKATDGLDAIAQTVREAVQPAVRWADSVMTRHMAHFHSARLSHFDPGEVAFAAQMIVRSNAPYDVNTILAALDITAKSQRPDGTWPAQQPIIWRASGVAVYTHSVQVATAIASTMAFLIGDGDVFAARPAGVTPRLAALESVLRRTTDWLAGTVQHVRWPAVTAWEPGKDHASNAVGWCSDRGFETGRIDLSVTANVVEFLLEFRGYCQMRINTALIELFSAYAPRDLPPLGSVKPTDLDLPAPQRLLPRLFAIVAGHGRRRMSALSWGAKEPKVEPDLPSSMIFSGPPGTSKTTLAKAIARELGWPLIGLTPSDFLARGEENIEARAREIFQWLGLGQRVVYLFDEVDELLLSREYQQREPGRSVFSFLTPSFLTKLQDLHDVSKQNSIMFIIGTNYVERIDPAARRRGRIDREFPVLYPDRKARIAIVIDSMRTWVGNGKDDAEKTKRKEQGQALMRQFTDRVGKATGLFSYNGMRGVWSWLVEQPNDEAREKGLEKIRLGPHSLGPEIDLSLYSERPGAVGEFLSVLGLCKDKFDAASMEQQIGAFWVSLGPAAQAFWKPKVMRAVSEAQILTEDSAIKGIFEPRQASAPPAPS